MNMEGDVKFDRWMEPHWGTVLKISSMILWGWFAQVIAIGAVRQEIVPYNPGMLFITQMLVHFCVLGMILMIDTKQGYVYPFGIGCAYILTLISGIAYNDYFHPVSNAWWMIGCVLVIVVSIFRISNPLKK